MKLTKEKTNWIITEGHDCDRDYCHVVLIKADKDLLDELQSYVKLTESLSDVKALTEVVIENYYGYLIKSRDNTEDLFPGWEEMVENEGWCYLECSDDEINKVIDRYDDSGDINEMRVSIHGFVRFQFCPEVADGQFLYYDSEWIKIAEIL